MARTRTLGTCLSKKSFDLHIFLCTTRVQLFWLSGYQHMKIA